MQVPSCMSPAGILTSVRGMQVPSCMSPAGIPTSVRGYAGTLYRNIASGFPDQCLGHAGSLQVS